MGHTRLGRLPTTRKWKELVKAMAASEVSGAAAEIPFDKLSTAIAAQAVDAAGAALERAIHDPGLREAYFLLTQVTLAAKHPNWQARMLELGIDVSPDATVQDLAAALQYRLDAYLSERRATSDFSEMALMALGESLIGAAGPWSETLFGSSGEDTILALRKLSTKSGFSHLGHTFFSAFMYRFLNFHLSRATAAHAGSTFPQVGDLTQFNSALRLHCEQSAYIVRDFCGQWYSKTEYKEGINQRNTSGFLATALRKLRDEIYRQGAANG